MPATAVSTALPHGHVLLRERDDEHGAERHHHGEQDVEEAVDRALERRARVAELARRAGDALRVAVGADCGHLERAAFPRPRTSPTAPPRPAARATDADSPVRTDSSSRSPGLDSRGAVGDDLVAGREAHQVALDELGDVQRSAGCRRGRRWPAGRRAPRARRASFRARSSCQTPMPVFATMIPRKSASRQSPKIERQQPEREQDRVERRDRVRPDDRRGRPARGRLVRLARAPRDAPQPLPRTALTSPGRG